MRNPSASTLKLPTRRRGQWCCHVVVNASPIEATVKNLSYDGVVIVAKSRFARGKKLLLTILHHDGFFQCVRQATVTYSRHSQRGWISGWKFQTALSDDELRLFQIEDFAALVPTPAPHSARDDQGRPTVAECQKTDTKPPTVELQGDWLATLER